MRTLASVVTLAGLLTFGAGCCPGPAPTAAAPPTTSGSEGNAPGQGGSGSGGGAISPAATGASGSTPGAGAGTDREHPVMRCGPAESYRYVASDFRCAGGTNPLGGDLRAGAAARVGNVGPNSTGHIIDLYRVACPEGAREIYVDMYGCPPGRSPY